MKERGAGNDWKWLSKGTCLSLAEILGETEEQILGTKNLLNEGMKVPYRYGTT